MNLESLKFFSLLKGKCTGFDDDYAAEVEQIKSLGAGKIVFLIVNDVPHFFLLSFVCVILSYKTLNCLISNKRKVLVTNEQETFFADCDIRYCINLMKINKKKQPENNQQDNKIKHFFKTNIYDWNENFRFSSRILNAHFVAFLALYYFFMDWIYYGILEINSLVGQTTNGLCEYS